MDDILVGRVMTADPIAVGPDALVEDAAELMRANDVGSVMVVDDDGHLEGILTSTDFVSIVAERKPKDKTPVSQYMSTDLTTAAVHDPIDAVARQMTTRGVHHLPVTDDDYGLVGVVSSADLTAYLSGLDAAGEDPLALA